jgi:hypothetical protein
LRHRAKPDLREPGSRASRQGTACCLREQEKAEEEEEESVLVKAAAAGASSGLMREAQSWGERE